LTYRVPEFEISASEDKTLELSFVLDDVSEVAVLRNRKMATIARTRWFELVESLLGLTMPLAGYRYPYLVETISATDFKTSRLLQKVLKEVVRSVRSLTMSDLDSEIAEHLRTVFCSQLIVDTYEKVGVELFDGVESNSASPNDLSRCAELIDVTEVVRSDDSAVSQAPQSRFYDEVREVLGHVSEALPIEGNQMYEMKQGSIETTFSLGQHWREKQKLLQELSDQLEFGEEIPQSNGEFLEPPGEGNYFDAFMWANFLRGYDLLEGVMPKHIDWPEYIVREEIEWTRRSINMEKFHQEDGEDGAIAD